MAYHFSPFIKISNTSTNVVLLFLLRLLSCVFLILSCNDPQTTLPVRAAPIWEEEQGLAFLYANETHNRHELLRRTQALVRQQMGRDRRIYWLTVEQRFARQQRKRELLQRIYTQDWKNRIFENGQEEKEQQRQEERDKSLRSHSHLSTAEIAELYTDAPTAAEEFEFQKNAFLAQHGDIHDGSSTSSTTRTSSDSAAGTVEQERPHLDNAAATTGTTNSAPSKLSAMKATLGRDERDSSSAGSTSSVVLAESTRIPDHGDATTSEEQLARYGGAKRARSTSAANGAANKASGVLGPTSNTATTGTSNQKPFSGTTSSTPAVDPDQYLRLLQQRPPGLVSGYKNEHRVEIDGHKLTFCGLDQLCLGSACEYAGGNITSDGTVWVGQDSVAWYNETSCGRFCSCKSISNHVEELEKERQNDRKQPVVVVDYSGHGADGLFEYPSTSTSADEINSDQINLRRLITKEQNLQSENTWRIAHKTDGCGGTIIPTRTIFLNRPMMSGHLGYGSRINTWLRVTNLAIHVGHGFQLSQHSCPVEHRGHPHCFFQPASKCGRQFRTMNSDGWVFEPDYYAACRFLLGEQAPREEMDVCSRDELYMYRAIARRVLKVQPDVLHVILEKYILSSENLKQYRFADLVNKQVGRDFTTATQQDHHVVGQQKQHQESGDRMLMAAKNVVGVAGRVASSRTEGGTLSTTAEVQVSSNYNDFHSWVGVLEEAGTTTDDAHHEEDPSFVVDTKSSRTGGISSTTTELQGDVDQIFQDAVVLRPFAGMHIRSTDNVGRFRHGVCHYADKLELMMRFYSPDRKERERLLKTPGGWHNSLERLYEDGNLNPYSMHVKKKKEFSMTELLEGRYKGESDYEDLQHKELKARNKVASVMDDTTSEVDRLRNLREFRSTHKEKTLNRAEQQDGGAAHDTTTTAERTSEDEVQEKPPEAEQEEENDDEELEERVYFDKSSNSTTTWQLPTKIRTVFVATDNCTKLVDFQNCDAYKRNRWTLASFCRREDGPRGELSGGRDQEDRASDTTTQTNRGTTKAAVISDSAVFFQGHQNDQDRRGGLPPEVAGENKGPHEQDQHQSSTRPAEQQPHNADSTTSSASTELVDQLVSGEVDLSEAENIHHTAKMLAESEWSHPKRGTGAEDLYRLWAEVILLTKATFAVGTFSSNLSRLVQVLRQQPQNTMLSLDMRWKPG
ncbi:unnamed protein product [Amoebophrya sp. A120]|nr:unnamed protein product [Amoebophrya sp. A120]|eukprot:GSA120T00001155001.1